MSGVSPLVVAVALVNNHIGSLDGQEVVLLQVTDLHSTTVDGMATSSNRTVNSHMVTRDSASLLLSINQIRDITADSRMASKCSLLAIHINLNAVATPFTLRHLGLHQERMVLLGKYV